MTTRASAKAAGRQWERRCGEYMRPVFPHVERRRPAGRFDRGDLINTGDWTIECKNQKSIDLSGWLDEAVKQQANTGSNWHALVINRRNHEIDKAYVVMTFDQFRTICDLMMRW